MCTPSRQLGWLEMALSPGDHCHSLLVRGGLAQPPQPRTDTFSCSGGRCWWVARGGCDPKVGVETSRTAPHLPWLSGLLLEIVLWGDAEMRTPGRGRPCPTRSFPPLPFSLGSCSGPEQAEVAKNGEFLVHLDFSAPGSDSRSHPSPWQPLCQDHPRALAPMSASHPTQPTAICGNPGEEPSVKIKMLGD